jgi:hypothetical protein
MKRLFLLAALILIGLTTFAQQQTDSTYTTFTTEQVNGFTGNDTCQHEWFVSTNVTRDTVNMEGLLWTKTQTVSRQCTKCGKQTTTLNIWKTYAKDEEDTTGGN